MDWIYLDNNATTQPAPEVLQALDHAQREWWANPSSVHRLGQGVRRQLDQARMAFARLLHCKHREIIFTSGGTESNNLALRGVLAPRSLRERVPPSSAAGEGDSCTPGLVNRLVGESVNREEAGKSERETRSPRTPSPQPSPEGRGVETLERQTSDAASQSPNRQIAKSPNPTPDTRYPTPVLITTHIEHSAIREPAEDLLRAGVGVVYVPVDRNGRVDPASVAAALGEHAAARTILVSIQWANNETGVIQPIADIARVIAAARGNAPIRIFLHADATQATGKIPVDVQAAGADLLTFAAHKFHGPKGVGGLFVRTGIRLQAQNRGGPQERELRGGTENAPAIIAAGVAADLAVKFLADQPAIACLTALRDRFEQGVRAALPDVVINSAGADRLWNTSNLAFPHIEAEAILLGLSERGLCASAGAACSSGSLEPSPVLLAMGIPEPLAHGSLRFSLSRYTTDDDIDRALALIPQVVARLRQTLPMPTA